MSSWALVKVSVADVRREPDLRAEQVTQTIMGMALELLDQHQDWYKVRLPDGYVGWINEPLLQLCKEELVHQWANSRKVMVSSQVALILSRRQKTSIPVSDVVMGTELLLVGKGDRWNQVALPDGRHGWIANRDISDRADLIHMGGGSSEEIIRTARSFTGLPYMWGGATPKGFDCSGFVQTVFGLNGFQLPRDAHQQFSSGQEVSCRENLMPADLLFFRPQDSDRITHVTIHIQGGKFIHCLGYVRTGSLEPSADDYDAFLRAKYVGARRVVRGLLGEC
ncbi:C40 family peptidase [bacterium]|nr:C40 family peptidase [bacterium]